MIETGKASVAVVLAACGLLGWACNPAAADVRIDGQVQIGGGPLASSIVTLWAASAGEPKQLAQTKTGADGRFRASSAETPGKDVFLYLVAKGGTLKAVEKSNDAIALMTLLGAAPPATVIVNELTTVASTFTAARFLKGEAMSGNPLGLRIAAENAPNLVDPMTGKWGRVLLDPLNSSMTTTMAKLDTLGSLISAYATLADDDWRARFLKAATLTGVETPKHARSDGRHCPRTVAAPKELYGLFDEAYPLPAGVQTDQTVVGTIKRHFSRRPFPQFA